MSQDRIQTLPKAEIHLHFEGCIEVAEIEAMALEAGVALPRPGASIYQFTGLSDFLDLLDLICGLARTPDQLARLAYRVAARVHEHGALYGDVIVNPTHWSPWRTRIAAMIEAFDRGFKAAEADGLPPIGLCVSLLRQQTSDEAIELVDLLLALRHPRVVALSVDGNELAAGRTGQRFAEAFRRAAAGGLHRTVHAGESSGPDGVWDAIDLLGADRIDHGVRAIEDPALVDRLAERQIPLDICPSSNLSLRLYPSLDQHPIERLRRAGVPVSINTDDPVLLRTGLGDEYRACATTFGWDDGILRAVARTSIEASFAPAELKASALAAVAAW